MRESGSPSGSVEKWWDSDYILKKEPVEFLADLDVGYEKEVNQICIKCFEIKHITHPLT